MVCFSLWKVSHLRNINQKNLNFYINDDIWSLQVTLNQGAPNQVRHKIFFKTSKYYIKSTFHIKVDKFFDTSLKREIMPFQWERDTISCRIPTQPEWKLKLLPSLTFCLQLLAWITIRVPTIQMRLDSNIESKSSNNTYFNIIEIFNKLFKK